MGTGELERDRRRAWLRAMKEKEGRTSGMRGMSVRTAKGIGPNKACGHKGGICRQGSRRG